MRGKRVHETVRCEGGLVIDPMAELRPHPEEREVKLGSVIWAVYESSAPSDGPSLIFESSRIVRRVRTYPADWRELTDEALIALSWSR